MHRCRILLNGQSDNAISLVLLLVDIDDVVYIECLLMDKCASTPVNFHWTSLGLGLGLKVALQSTHVTRCYQVLLGVTRCYQVFVVYNSHVSILQASSSLTHKHHHHYLLIKHHHRLLLSLHHHLLINLLSMLRCQLTD